MLRSHAYIRVVEIIDKVASAKKNYYFKESRKLAKCHEKINETNDE